MEVGRLQSREAAQWRSEAGAAGRRKHLQDTELPALRRGVSQSIVPGRFAPDRRARHHTHKLRQTIKTAGVGQAIKTLDFGGLVCWALDAHHSLRMHP